MSEALALTDVKAHLSQLGARRGTYRVIYRIDGEHRRVTVVGVVHRADACRSE
jgi:mRNA-degrading endonuclease RelE of RelBE toxin-antitoxin system